MTLVWVALVLTVPASAGRLVTVIGLCDDERIEVRLGEEIVAKLAASGRDARPHRVGFDSFTVFGG